MLRAAELLLQAGRPPIQLILIDCAQRRLDDKRLGEQPPLARLGRPLLKQLVRRRAVIQPLLRLLARPAAVRQALAQAYPSGGHCDDELVELLLAPSRRQEASESFRGFVNLFDEELAPSLLARLPCRCGCCGARPTPGSRWPKPTTGPAGSLASANWWCCRGWGTAPSMRIRPRWCRSCGAGWRSRQRQTDLSGPGPSCS